MNSHPTDVDLVRFREGRLTPEQILDIDDHLARCEVCRTRMAHGILMVRAMDHLHDRSRLVAHLNDEQIQAAAVDRVSADDAAYVRAHLDGCADCRAQMTELREWVAAAAEPEMVPRQDVARVRRWPMWIAAAAILFVGISIALWPRREAAPPAPILDGITALSSADRERVLAAVEAGVAEPPAFLAELDTGRELLLGPTAEPPAFAVSAPLATAVVSDRPMFAWQRLDGADSYLVQIFDEQLQPILTSDSVIGTVWTPPQPLERARTLLWQVTARAANGRVMATAPAPPAPPARFRVVDAATASAVDAVVRTRPDAHLVLGVLCAQAGARDEAISYLERVPPGDPRRRIADATLARLGR